MNIWREKKNYALRLVPCSMYDFERMASWLSDMAQNGYILCKLVLGVALFKRQEPQNMRYRLCELPYDSIYHDRSPSSEMEMIAICKAGGWNYIASRGPFGIFAAEDDSVPELDTETQIQYGRLLGYLGCLIFLTCVFFAMSFGFLELGWLLVGIIFAALLFSCVNYGNHIPRSIYRPFYLLSLTLVWDIFTPNGYFITWINKGSDVFVPFFLCSVFITFLVVYAFAGPVKFLLRIKSIKPFNYTKNWRWKAPVYRFTSVGIVVIVLYIVITFLNSYSIDRPEENQNRLQPLAEYPGTFPFATMENFVTEQPVTTMEWDNESKAAFDVKKIRARDVPNILHHWDEPGNHLELKSDWIAPEVLYFQQEASIQLAGGQEIQGCLSVTYYETKASWLAWELMREYETFAQERLEEDYQVLDLPDLGVDQALAYTDAAFAAYPRLLLRNGNRVAKVYFYQEETGYVVPLEQWSQVFADSLKKYKDED